MTKKKHWLLISIIIIFVMIGCYLLGSSTNQNENDRGYSSFNTQTSNSSPSSYNIQSSKDYSEKTTEQMPQTDNMVSQKQQMVYHANVYLHVNKLLSAKNELDKIAKQTSSVIISSSDSQNSDERNLQITYNVPQTKFQTFLDHIKKISDTTPDIQIQGDDVSEELVDLGARIKAKKAMEARLLSMMSKAASTKDLLDIENTLGTVQEQLEQLTGRQQYLQHRVAFSTVTVEVRSTTYQALQTKQTFVKQISKGFFDSCQNLWTGLQLLIIWLAKALPFFLLIFIIAVPIIWFIRKRQKK